MPCCSSVLAGFFCLLLLLPASVACGAAKAELEAEKAKIEQGIKKYEINIRQAGAGNRKTAG